MKPRVIIAWYCNINAIVLVQTVSGANKQLCVLNLGREIATRRIFHISHGSIEMSSCNGSEFTHLFWIERISAGPIRETNGQPTSLSSL